VVVLNDVAHVDGGGSKVAIDSALGLASRGVDVTLLAGSGPVASDLDGRVRVRCTGQAKISDEPDRVRAMLRGLWNVRAADAVSDLLQHHDPQSTVVHVHNWTKTLSSAALYAAHRAGFSMTMTLHDYFTMCPNGCYYDHVKAEICTRRPMSPACVAANCDSRNAAAKLYRVARQLVQRTAGGIPGSMRHFIYVSDFSYRVIAPYLPSEARAHRIPAAIDIPRAKPVRVGENSAVVYVGRLSPEKGVALLAASARKARVPVVFVGDGPERARIANMDPGARVTGWLTHEQVRDVLAKARCLVLPSLWYEASPLTVFEAAALGVPAIVPDTCAATEFVANEKNGLIFRSGSVDGLADALRRISDSPLVERMGREAYRIYWEQPLTLDAHVDRLLSVYEEMLAEHIPCSRLASDAYVTCSRRAEGA
jgi:glycosyltransferase involved in cell wall biosynthesis